MLYIYIYMIYVYIYCLIILYYIISHHIIFYSILTYFTVLCHISLRYTQVHILFGTIKIAEMQVVPSLETPLTEISKRLEALESNRVVGFTENPTEKDDMGLPGYPYFRKPPYHLKVLSCFTKSKL